jgi:hypothetical protein
MGDHPISASENIRFLGVALKHDFDVVSINLQVGDCTGLINTEGAVDRGSVDNEGRHGFEKRIGLGWGAGAPPVARYPTTSQAAVAILCPHGEALGARLAEHPIGLGDAAIGVGDTVAVGSLGTCLEGGTPLAVGLCQVQQQGGSESADDPRAGDQQGSDSLGVTHEGGEAGGGDDGKHRSQVVVGGSLSPRCS